MEEEAYYEWLDKKAAEHRRWLPTVPKSKQCRFETWMLQEAFKCAGRLERALAFIRDVRKIKASPWNPDQAVTALIDLKTMADYELAQIEQPQTAPETGYIPGSRIPWGAVRPLNPAMTAAQREWEQQPQAAPAGLHYTSTACQHGLHARCRKQCKFCEVACRCSCHQKTTEPHSAS